MQWNPWCNKEWIKDEDDIALLSRSSQSSTSHPQLYWSSLRTGIVILTSVSPDPQARLLDPVRTTQPPSPCSAHGSADVAGEWRCEGGVAPQSVPGEGLGLSASILYTHTRTHTRMYKNIRSQFIDVFLWTGSTGHWVLVYPVCFVLVRNEV